MEPSGRNPWQPVANAQRPRTAELSQIRCRGLPPVAVRASGKEGVDGSSPSEGFTKATAYEPVPFAVWTIERTRDVHQTSTKRRNDQSKGL